MFKWFTRRYTKTRNHNSICDSLNNTILNLFHQNQHLKGEVQKQKEEIEELTLRLKNQKKEIEGIQALKGEIEDIQKLTRRLKNQSFFDLPLTIADLNDVC